MFVISTLQIYKKNKTTNKLIYFWVSLPTYHPKHPFLIYLNSSGFGLLLYFEHNLFVLVTRKNGQKNKNISGWPFIERGYSFL